MRCSWRRSRLVRSRDRSSFRRVSGSTSTLAIRGRSRTISVTPPSSEIPLFVKDGGLVPMIPERVVRAGATRDAPARSASLRHGPGATAVYDDDGETFDYERGAPQLDAIADGSRQRRTVDRPCHRRSVRTAVAICFSCLGSDDRMTPRFVLTTVLCPLVAALLGCGFSSSPASPSASASSGDGTHYTSELSSASRR